MKLKKRVENLKKIFDAIIIDISILDKIPSLVTSSWNREAVNRKKLLIYLKASSVKTKDDSQCTVIGNSKEKEALLYGRNGVVKHLCVEEDCSEGVIDYVDKAKEIISTYTMENGRLDSVNLAIALEILNDTELTARVLIQNYINYYNQDEKSASKYNLIRLLKDKQLVRRVAEYLRMKPDIFEPYKLRYGMSRAHNVGVVSAAIGAVINEIDSEMN